MSKQVTIQMIEEQILIICKTNANLFVILEEILTEEELEMFFYSYEREENDV